MKNIDEAIKGFESAAEDYERGLKVYENMNDEDRLLFKEEENECKEYAKEHRQLAEWMKELKAYRETREILEIINKNEAESEDKKDIERQMCADFHELTAKYYYYINAYEDMTKAGLPPCFTPRIDAKYIKCLADGIEQALGAIVTATKDLRERSGIDGEQRGQG